MKHKILIVGNSAKDYLETIYKNNFNFFGHNCQVLDICKERNFIINFFDHQKLYSFFENYFLRKLISKNINDSILNKVNSFKPNIIFFFNLNLIFPETLDLIKKKKIITMQFLPDNYYDIKDFNRVEINNTINMFDINFVWGENHLNRIKKNTYLLDFAWNSLSSIGKSNNLRFKYDISFMGFIDKFRENILFQLKKKNHINIIGTKSFSSKLFKSKVKYFNKTLSYKSYIELSKASIINLNLLREQNIIANGTNQRTFELPGEKCFMIQNWTKRSAYIFEDYSNEILFKTIDESNDKISKFLVDKLHRKKLIYNCFKIIRSNHTYLHRVKKILKLIK